MSVIDDYLKNVSAPERADLERIRRIVKSATPEAEEIISYGMPGFKYRNKPLIWFAAFKNHLSIFPTAGPIEQMRRQLEGFKLSKGTIQFTLEKPLPDPLIKELVRLRMNQIDHVAG
jgi:uncharacterized protein YdhG (YjbR/CyaY superfamily)